MYWYEIRDPQDAELDRLAERYRLHPLHIEDCRHRHQAAKLEEGDAYLFVVLKPLEVDKSGDLISSDVDVFVGKDWVITVVEDGPEVVKKAMGKLRGQSNELRPDQFLYKLMDAIVDAYVPILDHYNDDIDEIEDIVLERPEPPTLERIFDLKRHLMLFRRICTNMRDVSNHLQRMSGGLLSADLGPFWRDVYDHLARNLDTVETQRDLLTNAMDIYLSSVANRTNQVMKVLTILSTVALPAVIISGIYGMNVKGIPWLDSAHGFAIVMGLMAATTIVLLLLFRVLRWI